MIVDASVLVEAVVRTGPRADWAEAAVTMDGLQAPQGIFAETCNVLARLERAGLLRGAEATEALHDALATRITLCPFDVVASRVWELRHNVTVYDARYVALAEITGEPLATLDRRLAAAPGTACRFLLPD